MSNKIEYVIDVTKRNRAEYLYLSGDVNTDGSRRFCIDSDTACSEIQIRVDGVWQPASFEVGANTLWVGPNVGVAALGHHMATESADGHMHFHVHSEFDGEVSVTDAQILHAYGYLSDIPIQPDDSTEWSGTSLKFSTNPTSHSMLDKLSAKTGAIAATDNVRLIVRTGDPDTGDIKLDQKYSASLFTANTTVALPLTARVEFEAGETFYFEYSSDSTFSLKMNAAGDWPWAMISYSMVREDNLLQTRPWVDGYDWDENDYFIKGKKIHICNQDGIQTGTFEDNADKWSTLGMEHTQYWQRVGTALSPAAAGDDIQTSGKIRVTGGGIFLERTGNDPYLSFVKNSTSQGQIRADSDMIGIYSPTGSTRHFAVDTGAGTVYCYDDLRVGESLYVAGKEVVGNTGNVLDDALPKSDDWDEAYNWGDHALEGYLTTETDPIYSASAAASIVPGDLLNWDQAYSWGNHADAGYVETETDPVFTAWDKSTGISITESQISDLTHTPEFDGDIASIGNSAGLFKIQPGAEGDVELFGDTDVGNADNGKIFKVWRRAAEGNDYLRFYISSGRTAYIHADRQLTLQAQQPFTINSVTDDIVFKVGDNAGAKKVYFKDSDGTVVAKIDSNGVFTLDANTGGKINLVRGTVNKISNFFDSTYTDLRFEGEKDYNRIGTWVNKPFQIVTNSTNRVTIDNGGLVGIGTNSPSSPLHIVKDSETLLHLTRDTDTEDGTAASGILFGVRSVPDGLTIQNKGAVLFKRTGTYGRGDLVFAVNNEGNNDNASLEDAVVTIDKYGRVEMASSLTVGDDLTVTDDILSYKDIAGRNLVSRGTVLFQDKSTQGEAGERHFSQGHTHTAIYNNNFYDADAESISERDMHFSPDGLTMYIIGLANSGAGDCSIWEYSLTIPWDLSTAGSPTVESIETYGSNQVGLFIDIDGRRLWTVCTANDTVIEYSMSPWNISNLTWVQAKDISGQETSPSAIFWSANGDRLFIAGDNDNDIVAFSVTQEWDISGISWFENFGTDINAPTGLHFSSDGRRMYVMDGSAEDDIHEFHLSDPWRIATARLVNLFDVSRENLSPQGIFLTSDNSKIFMVGTGTPDGVYGYSLGLEVGGTIISNWGPIRPGSMSTAQRDALVAVNGDIIYNETTEAFNFYENGAWGTK